MTKLTPLESVEALRVVQCQWAPSGGALVFEGTAHRYVSNLWRLTVNTS